MDAASLPAPEPGLPAPPWPAFHADLVELARGLAAAGDETSAARLEALTERWWDAQRHWTESLAELLRIHHDINNALVGVGGNAQLLMMGPAGQEAKGRGRLEVILREAGRIEQVARRLGDLRAQLRDEPPDGGRRAAGRTS
jgi:signal transduction histidine kinase